MTDKLTIPQVRARLTEISLEIDNLVEQLKRRPPVRKARVKCRTVTPLVAASVRTFAAMNKKASYKEIGEIYNLNTGRVSEILAGKRGE